MSIEKKVLVRILVAVLAITVIGIGLTSFNDKEYTITVTDKERVYIDDGDGKGKSKYLVFGESSEGTPVVFENTDTIYRLKWNSSTIQATLREGCTYRITVVGYRIPFISAYQNIIKVEVVKDES